MRFKDWLKEQTEDPHTRLIGTNSIVDVYVKDTPGMSIKGAPSKSTPSFKKGKKTPTLPIAESVEVSKSHITSILKKAGHIQNKTKKSRIKGMRENTGGFNVMDLDHYVRVTHEPSFMNRSVDHQKKKISEYEKSLKDAGHKVERMSTSGADQLLIAK